MDISTDEAASRLGVSRRRVVDMLRAGDLVGRQMKRVWLVDLSSVHEREATRGDGGRPYTAESVRSIIESLSFGSPLRNRLRDSVAHRSSRALAAAAAQSIVVERFETRDTRVGAFLHLTGESAIGTLARSSEEDLVGSSKIVHGYLRGLSLDDLVDEARLVNSVEGNVHVHRFRDGLFPWQATPAALIAIDALRSRSSRARDLGERALDRMRMEWLANATS